MMTSHTNNSGDKTEDEWVKIEPGAWMKRSLLERIQAGENLEFQTVQQAVNRASR